VLTTPEIQRHLTHLTYKPGWMVRVYDGRWEGQHLAIRAELEDATRPGHTTTIDVQSMLPPIRDTQALEEWLAWRLGRLELHEMREWFKRDGRPIFDPHAELAERDLP
jgi:hypothetical protein